jgi:hypothetical protein
VKVSGESLCAETHGVTRHFFSRALGLFLTHLYVYKRDAQLYCSSYSYSILNSDAEKRVVNCTVACSVSAVDRLSSNTPLSVRDNTYLRKAQ